MPSPKNARNKSKGLSGMSPSEKGQNEIRTPNTPSAERSAPSEDNTVSARQAVGKTSAQQAPLLEEPDAQAVASNTRSKSSAGPQTFAAQEAPAAAETNAPAIASNTEAPKPMDIDSEIVQESAIKPSSESLPAPSAEQHTRKHRITSTESPEAKRQKITPLKRSNPDVPIDQEFILNAEDIFIEDDDVIDLDSGHETTEFEFNPAVYRYVKCFINTDLLLEHDISSREITHKHVTFLVNKFEMDGLNPSMGTISVIHTSAYNHTNPRWKDESERICMNVFVVDGRHRLRTLRILKERNPDVWEPICKNLPVTMILRKDGNYCTTVEMLSLSSYHNTHSSAVLAPGFLDLLHAAISCIRVFLYLNQGRIHLYKTAVRIRAAKTLGNLDIRQITRYVKVAVHLAQDPNKYKVFKEACRACPQIGLTHVSCNALLDFKDIPLFRLALTSVSNRIYAATPGSFEDLRNAFYQCLQQIYDLVKVTATYKQISVDELLATEFALTAKHKSTLEQYITAIMARFNRVENQTSSDKIRLKNVRKKLIVIFGDDIAPKVAPEQEASATRQQNTGDAEQPRPQPQTRTVAQSGDARISNAQQSSQTQLRRSTRQRKNVAIHESSSEYDIDDINVVSVPSSKKTKQTTRRGKKPHSSRAAASVSTPQTTRTGNLSSLEVIDYLKTKDLHELSDLLAGTGLGFKIVPSSSTQPAGSIQQLPDASHRPTSTPTVTGNSPHSRTTPASAGESSLINYDTFNDSVPQELPWGSDDPTPCNKPGPFFWTRLVSKIPSRWPKKNPITHPSSWMTALHIPHEHRAHVVINDVETLRSNHHTVFLRAGHSFFRKMDIEELPPLSNKFKNVKGLDKFWAAALDDDDAGLEFFAQCREQLHQQGFCIFENFLDDARMPDKIGTVNIPKVKATDIFFQSLQGATLKTFPAPEDIINPVDPKVWDAVENVDEVTDAAEIKHGRARLRQTHYGITTAIESNPDLVWMVRDRALLDIRIGQAVSALKICVNTRENQSKMFIPRIGGRWMLTSTQCKQQALHTDFELLNRQDTLSLSGNPGYFSVCTGKDEYPLWVCAGSHRSLATISQSTIGSLSDASFAHMVRVPPFSIFLGRGDLHHAGSSFAQGNYNRHVRYYTYFVPESRDIPIYNVSYPAFNPRFKANLHDDTDEEEVQEESQHDHRKLASKAPIVRPPPVQVLSDNVNLDSSGSSESRSEAARPPNQEDFDNSSDEDFIGSGDGELSD